MIVLAVENSIANSFCVRIPYRFPCLHGIRMPVSFI